MARAIEPARFFDVVVAFTPYSGDRSWHVAVCGVVVKREERTKLQRVGVDALDEKGGSSDSFPCGVTGRMSTSSSARGPMVSSTAG